MSMEVESTFVLWRVQVADPRASKEHLDPPEYQRVLLDSYFTLCPAGHAFETFRFWEAVDVLSIPIIVYGQAPTSAGAASSSSSSSPSSSSSKQTNQPNNASHQLTASEISGAVDWDLVRDYSVGRCVSSAWSGGEHVPLLLPSFTN